LEGRGPELGAMRPDVPDGFGNRLRDKWHALFAIADAAGGKWPERARKAALAIDDPESDDKPNHALLRTVVAIAHEWPHAVIFGTELDAALAERGVKLSKKMRGNRLNDYGLKSEPMRRGKEQ